jgi:glycosyltransferase involved in cell wall biosynthesis
MAYDIVEFLKIRHDVRVLTNKPVPGFQRGVEIVQHDVLTLKREFIDADVVLTHLDFTAKAHNICRVLGKHHLYAIVHNTFTNNLMENRPGQFNIIYNSHYTATLDLKQRSTICRPPIVPERYNYVKKTGENAITLVNCWADKGGEVLVKLAKIMPDRKFIGVLGGYGDQVRALLPNLEYVTNGPNMAEIYARTGVLIQPSKYESYGKAACEAMSCGIPVVCTDTPGLRESLDYAGIFVPRDAEAYKEAIESIDYDYQLPLLEQRTADLVAQTETDLINLQNFIECKI